MAKIEKGKILSLEGSDENGKPNKAKVQANTSQGAITMAITIPWYLRGDMGELKKNTEVAFVVFEDGTGLVIARLDGEWGKTVHGDVKIDGEIESKDLKTEQAKFNTHVHSGVESGGSSTSTPE